MVEHDEEPTREGKRTDGADATETDPLCCSEFGPWEAALRTEFEELAAPWTEGDDAALARILVEKAARAERRESSARWLSFSLAAAAVLCAAAIWTRRDADPMRSAVAEERAVSEPISPLDDIEDDLQSDVARSPADLGPPPKAPPCESEGRWSLCPRGIEDTIRRTREGVALRGTATFTATAAPQTTELRIGVLAFEVAGDASAEAQLVYESSRRSVTLVKGAMKVEGKLLTEGDTVEFPTTRAVSTNSMPAEGESAGELLREAQEARAAGQRKRAAERYRRLVTLHPKSVEARSALVSLGQLELDELQQPRAALRHFEKYLRHPGPLAEEAAYGRIRALRSLGRREAELDAIDQFLRAHTESGYAGALRSWKREDSTKGLERP